MADSRSTGMASNWSGPQTNELNVDKPPIIPVARNSLVSRPITPPSTAGADITATKRRATRLAIKSASRNFPAAQPPSRMTSNARFIMMPYAVRQASQMPSAAAARPATTEPNQYREAIGYTCSLCGSDRVHLVRTERGVATQKPRQYQCGQVACMLVMPLRAEERGMCTNPERATHVDEKHGQGKLLLVAMAKNGHGPPPSHGASNATYENQKHGADVL